MSTLHAPPDDDSPRYEPTEGIPDGRTFTSTLLLVAGPLGAAGGWLSWNEVSAALIYVGLGATVAGALLRPTWPRGAFAVLGLLFGCWPWVLAALAR